MTKVLHAPKIAVLYALLVCLKSTHCSLFADLGVTEFCDNKVWLCRQTDYEEHVVCQYHDKIGPTCTRFREVPLDINDANEILKQINSIRSQAAQGLSVGKDKQPLLQAYGMMKVSWDNELASIAKIMIHQCLNTHTHGCAATENFTDPIMAVMYGAEDVETTAHADDIIGNVLAKWEDASHFTTSDQIFKAPDLKGVEGDAEKHRDALTLFYLKIVTGDVTHVGCAAAVYDMSLTEEGSHKVLAGQLFCYLSHYTKKNMQVYNTTKPLPGTMYTKCGCPPGYRETKACLCVPAPPITEAPDPITNQTERSTYQKPLLEYLTEKPQDSITPKNSTSISLQMLSILDPKIQKILRLTPKKILEPLVQKNEKLTLQFMGPTPIPKAGVRTPSNCNIEVNCPPQRIVILPVCSPQTVCNDKSTKRDPRLDRRFGNTSLVQSAIADGDFSFSEEDEISQNMSKLRSKLFQTLRRMRKNELLNFFSQEQNLKPAHRPTDATERNQNYSGPPSEHNLEFIKHILEHNRVARSQNGGYEQPKKRAMSLLDRMEKRGRTVRLNSQEIVQFDTKMRRIHKTMMSTRDQMQF